MTDNEPQLLRQTFDYIGALSTQLRDLLGYPTLINELIQNADDSRRENGTPTQSMTFDVRDEGLIVENDGIFSDCGWGTEEVCLWRQDQDRMCDFHRFLRIASGNKREEEDTTGAFGVGFISIYQITDRPELKSVGRHWVINPEKNGEIIQNKIPYANKTEFYFPWAMDANSRLRRALKAEPVSFGVTDKFVTELQRVIPHAIIFLRYLQQIALKKNGQLIKSVSRVPRENGLQVFDGDDPQHWYLLKGAFEEEGEALKAASSGLIEEDKKTEVAIAIPEHVDDCFGLLYAFLPSQHKTNLPFHINADFFPHSDRKRILFDSGYQGEWNTAAIRSAARLLAQNILFLRDRLGHRGLWKIIESAQGEGVQEVEEDEEVPKTTPFGTFWEEMKPRLIGNEVVFTSRQVWAYSGQTVWIRGEDEEALGVLEQIGLNIVHPDLRSHLNVLQNLGVQRLSARRLASELIDHGLTGVVPFEEAPQWLRNRDERYLLGVEVGRLLASEGSAKEAMAECAIALGRDHCFHAPEDLFEADDDTAGLFGDLDNNAPFIARDNPQAILDLVPGFGIGDALKILEALTKETLESHWAQDNDLPGKIMGWFEGERRCFRADEAFRKCLRQIPIIPSGDELRPLRELVIPGTFEDPLHLASVVDLDVLGDYREFLLELDAQALTIQTYAFREVPRAFNAGVEIPTEAISTLVGILASHRGELLEDGNIQRELSGCRLVECEDGVFRLAQKVYFKSREITEILGGDVSVAAVPEEHGESVAELYGWLGVADLPRAADLLDRISSIVEQPPTEKTKETIGKIFGYIGAHRSEGGSSFDNLKQQKWLPAQGNDREWFRPEKLYASYQRHLFESQAKFLDVPHTGRGGVRDFIDYLEIRMVPTTRQVINHLLWCVENDKLVNTEVYTTLNQRSQESLIAELRGRPCLLLESGQYVRPNQVFWGEHPFGRFRHRLGAEWRSYTALFEKLGVRENPEVEDVIAVLEEIEAEYRGRSLDEETRAVLMRCWIALDDKLQRGERDPGMLEELGEKKVVPNDQGALYPPIWMFFEDRSGLAERFGAFLEHNVIHRPQGAWRAMQAAGVRSLKSAVRIDLVECEGKEFDPDTTVRLKDSTTLVKRILDTTNPHEWDLSLLNEVQVFAVDELRVRLAIEVFNRTQQTGPEEVRTFFDREERILYFRRSAKALACAPMARELAAAMNTEGEVGHVAAGLKEVLSAPSVKAADEILDELGYARIEEVDEGPATDVDAVGMGAVEEPKMVENGEEGEVTSIGDGAEVGGEEDMDVRGDEGQEENKGIEGSGEDQVEGVDGEEVEGCADRSPEDGQEGAIDTGSEEGKSVEGVSPEPGVGDGVTTLGQNDSEQGKLHPGKKKMGRGGWYPVNVVRLSGDETGGGTGTGQGPDRVDRINEIDRAGIQHVLEYERRQGRIPREEAHNNPGYDIKSWDGLRQRFIEVKSIDGEWGEKGVALSDTQFDFGRDKGDRFWLYVVENALSPDANIYQIQKAAGLVNEFIFDRSWKKLAEEEE